MAHDLMPDTIRRLGLVDTDAEKLLLEWFEQWENLTDMPAKMGSSLHIRTALYWVEKQANRARPPDAND